VTTGDIRAALDDVAGIGPFFAVSANPAEVVDDSWRPLRELYTDPEPLAARIRVVAEALGGAEPRVAASITYQGLAARLVSPVLAAATVHRLVPPWSPDTVHWRPAVTGPLPLWESGTDDAARRPGPGELPATVAEVLVGPHLEALADAVRAVVSVSRRTLRGNAASAVVAAGRLVAQARPAAATRARQVVAELLSSGALAGSGTLEGRWAFRRRSCCLYYRVVEDGFCGDCVLTERPARSTMR
jgi:ferric iron reductase protein FhuF